MRRQPWLRARAAAAGWSPCDQARSAPSARPEQPVADAGPPRGGGDGEGEVAVAHEREAVVLDREPRAVETVVLQVQDVGLVERVGLTGLDTGLPDGGDDVEFGGHASWDSRSLMRAASAAASFSLAGSTKR